MLSLKLAYEGVKIGHDSEICIGLNVYRGVKILNSWYLLFRHLTFRRAVHTQQLPLK